MRCVPPNSAQHILELMLNVRCAILLPNPGLPAPIAFMQSPQCVHRMQSGPCSTQTTSSFGVSHKRPNVFQSSSVKGSPLKRDNRLHRPSVSCTAESAALEMGSAEVCLDWPDPDRRSTFLLGYHSRNARLLLVGTFKRSAALCFGHRSWLSSITHRNWPNASVGAHWKRVRSNCHNLLPFHCEESDLFSLVCVL